MQLIIHPHELTPRWIELAKKLKLERISLHPVGGKQAHENLRQFMQTLKDPSFRDRIDTLCDAGIEVGYEFHALSYLLPRELFETHPEYFRMDDQGARISQGNFCFSNPEARKIICDNAVKLAGELYRNGDEYYFWLDDASKLTCHCEQCKKHNFAYHQLVLMNEMCAALRKENPKAKVCNLAYFDGVALPNGDIQPAEGVFLEYAPYERYFRPEQFAFDAPYLQLVRDLVKLFGKEEAKVLEYWYDNSIQYRKAGKKLLPFTPDNDQIKKDFPFYRDLGFTQFTSFACSLCDEYVALYGDPDFSAIE